MRGVPHSGQGEPEGLAVRGETHPSCEAGLYMSFYAFGGTTSHVAFCLLALAWLFTAYRGYTTARARRFAEHRTWMIRNFALTLGAVTLRIQLGSSFAAGLRFQNFYPWLAWTAWVPNVLVAEWLVRKAHHTALRAATTVLPLAAKEPARSIRTADCLACHAKQEMCPLPPAA